jgi:hypothetical protein
MGFRNPLTAADPTTVDTGDYDLLTPGVRLYQTEEDNGDPGLGTRPVGVLEMRTGIAGDLPATVKLTAYTQTDGFGNTDVLGSNLATFAGAVNGFAGLTYGPTTEALVEDDPANPGTFRSRYRVAADRLEHAAPVYYASSRAGYTHHAIPGAFAAGWSRYSTANPGVTTWQDLVLWRQPDGTIRAQGLFFYTLTGATPLIYTLPAEWRPKTVDGRAVILPIAINEVAREVEIRTNGQIALRGGLPGAAAYCRMDLSWPGPEFPWTV